MSVNIWYEHRVAEARHRWVTVPASEHEDFLSVEEFHERLMNDGIWFNTLNETEIFDPRPFFDDIEQRINAGESFAVSQEFDWKFTLEDFTNELARRGLMMENVKRGWFAFGK